MQTRGCELPGQWELLAGTFANRGFALCAAVRLQARLHLLDPGMFLLPEALAAPPLGEVMRQVEMHRTAGSSPAARATVAGGSPVVLLGRGANAARETLRNCTERGTEGSAQRCAENSTEGPHSMVHTGQRNLPPAQRCAENSTEGSTEGRAQRCAETSTEGSTEGRTAGCTQASATFPRLLSSEDHDAPAPAGLQAQHAEVRASARPHAWSLQHQIDAEQRCRTATLSGQSMHAQSRRVRSERPTLPSQRWIGPRLHWQL
jgi:hypothetical protein